MKEAAISLGIDPAKVGYKLYVIRNGFMSPKFKKVKDNLGAIAERAFSTIIDAQGIGDVYKVYLFTQQKRGDFNLAFIPADFDYESKEMFDTEYMKALFDKGYADAVRGYSWSKVPPGLLEHDHMGEKL
jgi:hypothetical protein